MSLNSGSLSNGQFAGSMAEAIEKEFNSVWTAVYGMPLPEKGEKDRKIIFLAISRGILKYLNENENSIQVTRRSFRDHDVDLDVVIPDLI